MDFNAFVQAQIGDARDKNLIKKKFDSKAFAAREVANLIDDKEKLMGNIYKQNQNSVATDTDDLSQKITVHT